MQTGALQHHREGTDMNWDFILGVFTGSVGTWVMVALAAATYRIGKEKGAGK